MADTPIEIGALHREYDAWIASKTRDVDGQQLIDGLEDLSLNLVRRAVSKPPDVDGQQLIDGLEDLRLNECLRLDLVRRAVSKPPDVDGQQLIDGLDDLRLNLPERKKRREPTLWEQCDARKT